MYNTNALNLVCQGVFGARQLYEKGCKEMETILYVTL